jgi:hypothetical protein
VSAALCAAAPASAGDDDAFNSSGLRKAVTLEGVPGDFAGFTRGPEAALR